VPDGQTTGSKKLRELGKNWPPTNNNGHIKVIKREITRNIFRNIVPDLFIKIYSSQKYLALPIGSVGW
jgi:hypothetical protein